jgi:hypothetical protein
VNLVTDTALERHLTLAKSRHSALQFTTQAPAGPGADGGAQCGPDRLVGRSPCQPDTRILPLAPRETRQNQYPCLTNAHPLGPPTIRAVIPDRAANPSTIQGPSGNPHEIPGEYGQEKSWSDPLTGITDKRRRREGPKARQAGAGERGKTKTLLELSPAGNHRWAQVRPSPAQTPAPDAPPAPPARGGLLQFQLKRLIREILAEPDLDPNVGASLLSHLVGHPRHPERALLAHLRDVQDPEDLPPYRLCRE